MKKLALALVPFLLIGCGPKDENGDGIADGVRDPNNVSVVVPATPKGTVSGQVLTTQQRPLSGVNVAMTIGSSPSPKTSVTDEGGNFTFQDVPGGAQILLTFSKEGYAPLRAVSTVPTEAGNVPINNGNASFGPVLLSETNGSIKFTLISPTGRPAAGVKATLEVDGAGTVLFGPTDSISSTVVAEAVADAQGVVTFANVPPPAEIDRITTGSVYRLVVYAYDENNDGVLESNGLVRLYSGAQLITGSNAIPVSLPFTYSPTTPLAIDYSNIAALRPSGSILPQFNMLKPGDSIYIVFNQPVQSSSVIVGLADEYGREGGGITKNVTNGGLVLTLAPQGILAGKEYNLYLRAVSLNGGTAISRTVAFFGGDPAQPQAISIEATIRFWDTGAFNSSGVLVGRNNNQLDSGEYVSVSFNQAMKNFGSSAQVFFNMDLNSSTTPVPGEWNPNDTSITGFNLLMYEPLTSISGLPGDPTPVFGGIPASGFSSRYYFQYGNTSASYISLNAANTVPLVFAFGRIRSPQTDGYESIWGVPQTANLNVSATLVAIPFTP